MLAWAINAENHIASTNVVRNKFYVLFELHHLATRLVAGRYTDGKPVSCHMQTILIRVEPHCGQENAALSERNRLKCPRFLHHTVMSAADSCIVPWRGHCRDRKSSSSLDCTRLNI